MDPSQDFKSLQDAVQASLISTTRTVNRIASEDLTFQRTANPQIGDRLEDLSTRLLGVSSELINAAAKANGQRNVDSLEDTEDVDIHWAGIVDVIDGLLEKADTALDEYTGRVKRKIDIPEPPPSKKLKTNDRFEPNWRRANIIKPQNAFEKKVDNFATGPWKPLLTNKPHAIVPLEESLSMTEDGNNKIQYVQYCFLPFSYVHLNRCLVERLPHERKGFQTTNLNIKRMHYNVLIDNLDTSTHTKQKFSTTRTPQEHTRNTIPFHISQSRKPLQSGSTRMKACWKCWKS